MRCRELLGIPEEGILRAFRKAIISASVHAPSMVILDDLDALCCPQEGDIMDLAVSGAGRQRGH